MPDYIKRLCYCLGGILLFVGAVLPIFASSDLTPYVFSLGALLIAPIQMMDRYEGQNLIIRRLRRQQVMGALMLLVTGALMFCQQYGIPPFRGSEWKITLMIAAVLELYAVFRIDYEEKKS